MLSSVVSNVPSKRGSILRRLAIGSAGLLLIKMLISIVFTYRFYFPVDFSNAPFLAGRQFYFWGWYGTAFYVHILVGPIALLLVAGMLLTANRAGWQSFHRYGGRVLGVLVIGVLAPSGCLMATRAFSGPIAGWGFAILSLVTAVVMMVSIYFAVTRQFRRHRIWALRCFVLLCSPLILRLFSGALSVFDAESIWTYRFSAWASWLIPLLALEIYQVTISRRKNIFGTLQRCGIRQNSS
jgi:hypothetical protein